MGKFLTLMTLGKFVFFAFLGFAALLTLNYYQNIAFIEIPWTTIVISILFITLLDVTAFLLHYEPRVYFGVLAAGVIPTIAFLIYVFHQLLMYEGKTNLSFVFYLYIMTLLIFTIVTFNRRILANHLDSKVVSFYDAKKFNNFDGNKIINAFRETFNSNKDVSQYEKLLPFAPAFSAFFVKHFSTYLGMLFMIGISVFIGVAIIDFVKFAYSFIFIINTLRKAKKD
ncbi:MAG: hypothetical protein HPY85_07035 [Anaerolineae bacterium]|nr:hypothetical protein [Anaerolineae bacterium]